MEAYTDDTVLQKGKFKGHKLGDIDLNYFLKLYKNPQPFDLRLLLYIGENLKRIRSKKASGRRVLRRCTKIKYQTPEEADTALQYLYGSDGIGAYRCPNCKKWHHTSTPSQAWQAYKNQKRLQQQ